MSKRARALSAALASEAPANPAELSLPNATPAPTPEKQRNVGIQVYVHPSDHERLRSIAFLGKTNLQQLMIEAINLLMEKRGQPPLTPSTNNRPTGRNRG